MVNFYYYNYSNIFSNVMEVLQMVYVYNPMQNSQVWKNVIVAWKMVVFICM